MSSTQAFCFVEGKTDAFFYAEICKAAFASKGITYEIVRAGQIPGASGGKTVLRGLFLYLRRSGKLKDSSFGKKTISLFFLDKDVDDIYRRSFKSDHVIYTEYYTVENYLVRESDLIKCVAVSLSVDMPLLESRVGTSKALRSRLALAYKDWVKLCLYSVKYRIRECNFGSHSKVNQDDYGPVHPSLLATMHATIQSKSGVGLADYNRRYMRISKVVEAMYLADCHDRIFNGKWYFRLLEFELKRHFKADECDFSEIGKRVRISALSSLNFKDSWSEYYVSRLSRFITYF